MAHFYVDRSLVNQCSRRSLKTPRVKGEVSVLDHADRLTVPLSAENQDTQSYPAEGSHGLSAG